MAQVTVRFGPDIFLFPALEPGWEIAALAFVMKPWSRGSVRLRSFGPARAAGDRAWIPLRLARPRHADRGDREELRRVAGREPLRRYIASEIRPGPAVTAREWAAGGTRGFFHPTSTCAIGQASTVTAERSASTGSSSPMRR